MLSEFSNCSNVLPQIRILVNSRCQHACFYCRPSGEGVDLLDDDIDEGAVVLISKAFAELGVNEVKLSGGDPALWPPLVNCVKTLKTEVGIKSIQTLSRHPAMAGLAKSLAQAGVSLFNFSIDTLDRSRHKLITGSDDLPEIVDAVRQCVNTGVPCKINAVIFKDGGDEEIEHLIAFCEQERIQYLKLLDIISDLHVMAPSFKNRLIQIESRHLPELYEPMDTITAKLAQRAVTISTISQGSLGHPMLQFVMPSGLVVIAKDQMRGRWYGSVCQTCSYFPCADALMALRLTPDLKLQFCLLGKHASKDLSTRMGEFSLLKQEVAEALGVYRTAYFNVDTCSTMIVR